MTVADVHVLENQLEDVTAALAFLNVVRANNPTRTFAEITARADVQEAIALILDWLEQAESLLHTLPPAFTPDIEAGTGTIDGFRAAVNGDPPVWMEPLATNQLVLRMRWFITWMLSPFVTLLELLNGNTGQKEWVSRLAPNTCSYCRALHGVRVPLTDSFAAAARAVGWTRIYGTLMGPPLHPNCACELHFV